MTSSWNAALYLVSSCEESDTTCVAGDDGASPEQIDFTNPGRNTRTYHLIVDSRAAAQAGEYELTISIE